MLVELLGDLHCNITKCFGPNCIQVGDLCLEGYKQYGPYPNKKRYFIDGNHDYFPVLNPDAEVPYEIKQGLVYIPRGYVSGQTLFFGGANSVDFNLRLYKELGKYLYKKDSIVDSSITEAYEKLRLDLILKKIGEKGRLRWEDEINPILVEFYRNLPNKEEWFIEEEITEFQLERILNYDGEINVVVAHDCPYFIFEKLVINPIERFASCNRKLEKIFDKFQPELWIFGHHHHSMEIVRKNCKFICIGNDEKTKIDLPLANNFFD